MSDVGTVAALAGVLMSVALRMLDPSGLIAMYRASRADAGVVGGALVFLLPGSPAAVELALHKLIVPELAHAVGQLRRRHAHGASHG